MIVRVCIAVTCTLFVALGVLALIAGQLAVGCALLLCFGVGSLGILTMRADTRVDGTIVLADVEGERAFLLPADPRKRRLLLAASAGWAAAPP